MDFLTLNLTQISTDSDTQYRMVSVFRKSKGQSSPGAHGPPATDHDKCIDVEMPSVDDYLTNSEYPAEAY